MLLVGCSCTKHYSTKKVVLMKKSKSDFTEIPFLQFSSKFRRPQKTGPYW